MIYNDFSGLRLSSLGVGTMRLPVVNGDDSVIDEAKTQEMFDLLMANGVNYYDTAWGYHGGNSEAVTCRCLSKYPRDSWYLASKFPGYDPACWDRVEEIFSEQLRRCGVDHFDFYLFHNVCEMNIDMYLDPEYRVYDFLMEQKRAGRIRHLGFSAHGSIETTERFLNAYGKDMEFCQIELNWFDWKFQNAEGKVAQLNRWGIPIWVMEPVRGGQLARLSQEHEARLKALRPDDGSAVWAFRFLQDIPGVAVTLSGMSDLTQVRENIAVFSSFDSLSNVERETLFSVADEMISHTAVPCTACRYCVSHCPQHLDIPELLKVYNEALLSGPGEFIARMRIRTLPVEKRPSACLGCGACASVCPQQLEIPSHLRAFSDWLDKE